MRRRIVPLILGSGFLGLSVFLTYWLLLADGLQSLQALALGLSEHSVDLRYVLPVYALVSFFSQLIIVPSGSLILIFAGFFLGPLVAASVFAIAQLAAAWPVTRTAMLLIEAGNTSALDRLNQAIASTSGLRRLREDEFFAGIALRLTPVIPSAAACLLAAGLGFRLRTFLLATAAVCWVRPLFFASVGGAIGELSDIREILEDPAQIDVTPLFLLLIAAFLLWIGRGWMRGA